MILVINSAALAFIIIVGLCTYFIFHVSRRVLPHLYNIYCDYVSKFSHEELLFCSLALFIKNVLSGWLILSAYLASNFQFVLYFGKFCTWQITIIQMVIWWGGGGGLLLDILDGGVCVVTGRGGTVWHWNPNRIPDHVQLLFATLKNPFTLPDYLFSRHSWFMFYTKLSCILSQNEQLENHTLHSGTYPYSLYNGTTSPKWRDCGFENLKPCFSPKYNDISVLYTFGMKGYDDDFRSDLTLLIFPLFSAQLKQQNSVICYFRPMAKHTLFHNKMARIDPHFSGVGQGAGTWE